MSPIIVGRIGSAHGIKGWAKITSYTDPKANILSYRPWLLLIQGQWCAVKVLDGRPQGNGIIAHIEGYNTPEEIRQLVNIEIGIQRDQLPILPQGEYYWSDLIGLQVINTQNQHLGTIASLFETGANDVVVVKGEKEVLIPYIPQVVLAVDLEQRLMRVDWE